MSTTFPTHAPPGTGAEPTQRPQDRPGLSPRSHEHDASGALAAERHLETGDRVRQLWRRVRTVRAEGWVTLALVAACAGLIFYATHPDLVLLNTTPTGGDMGAHVWGPRFLMDHLLPKGRVTGWTPDWYSGFPAYEFYMVLPSLVVVALSIGIHNLYLGLVALLVAVTVALSGLVWPRFDRWRYGLLGLGVALAVLVVPVPYNIAFKLVVISGLVALPVAAWLFAKLADLPFPTPPLLAVAATFYVFNREPAYNGTGNIVGGNFASTMAGEFAFSISLSLAVVYLGVVLRGMRTGKHRAWAAVLLALIGLCHLLPLFFALLATVAIFAVQPAVARLKWLAAVLPVGGMVSAFWTLPFLATHAFTNDMGWEKLPAVLTGNLAGHSPWFRTLQVGAATYYGRWYYLAPKAFTWILVLAGAGVVVSLVNRRRAGPALALTTAALFLGFVNLPDAQLWNARLLPFLFLCYFFLAAIAVGEVVAAVAALLTTRPEPVRAFSLALTPVIGLFGLAVVALPLDLLPFSARSPVDQAVRWPAANQPADRVAQQAVNAAQRRGAALPAFAPKQRDALFSTKDLNPVGGWAEWNFRGLQGKEEDKGVAKGGWPELHAVIDTMGQIGKDPAHGCGRAMWEYDGPRESSYGTPMALMMLPYFTKGCIGSMEGLYFESSGTTPFHFLNQTELSVTASSSQRDLPYQGLNVALGVRHLQLLGVKYYMADSARTIELADADPNLEPLAVTPSGRPPGQPTWHVYEVKDSPLVTPLRYAPTVMTNTKDPQASWLGPAMDWYLDPSRWSVPLALDGPKDWPRITVDRRPAPRQVPGQPAPKVGSLERLPTLPRRSLPAVKVTKVRTTDDSVSFDVDRTGVPVLVKVSYFPNWKVSGGQGPYRVTPNLMVVVPGSRHVSLHYGRTSSDWLAILLTLAGIALVVLLARRPAVAMPDGRRWWHRFTEPSFADPADDPVADPTGDPAEDPVVEVDDPADEADDRSRVAAASTSYGRAGPDDEVVPRLPLSEPWPGSPPPHPPTGPPARPPEA